MHLLRCCLGLFLIAVSTGSCSKKEFLDEKPTTDVFIPGTLEDFYALLDNDAIMAEAPILGEASADNYYLNDLFWQSMRPRERNAYIWASDIFDHEGKIDDWVIPYRMVFYTNVVLEGLEKVPVTSANQQDHNMVKGMAHFFRAFAFYNLASIFAKEYDAATAGADLGIPLRLDTEVDKISVRATVQQTYDQILEDMQLAKELLPVEIAWSNRNRPTKPAAFALLARIHLSMRQYEKAGEYAASSLDLYNELIDFDTVSRTAILPFAPGNREVLFQNRLSSTSEVLRGIASMDCVVDTNLYASYTANDLRKDIFYYTNTLGQINAKGNLSGTIFSFAGLATDEMYLVRAECLARAEQTNAAMQMLNALLIHRWKANTFVPLTAASPSEALDRILVERRKEMPYRGVRWTDLKRLNKEGRNIVLTRKIDNVIYTLQPNSPLYVLPIPPDVLNFSDMPDNPR
ncbi:MAG: RagB/SusD family nutrient uptake outer membrane protein [Candidatus Pseudobacter hemicellulosilyticus]|uniref:RagB/SusD family nutrient uptake outer membrane protein n=1 Tax=Candidatus Pseudobacter hemicellulosilyticus TaxID=3121375 RepID=A0AAJ6BEA3_9BACT|nr:MAG: RagB/SusD family nutrient uptake outer membrane protein [Pseudobacter sp.]